MLLLVGFCLVGGIAMGGHLSSNTYKDCELVPVSEDSWEMECHRWGLGKLWDEWVSWAHEGFPVGKGWWLAMETGQELRRLWDDWTRMG